VAWNPFRRRKEPEQRQVQWPFDVGPPAYSPYEPNSADSALALTAVYSSVRLLADSVASLPLQVYRDVGDRSVRVRMSSLFDQPAVYGTLYDWLYSLMTSLLLHGNAYGLVTSRDGFGFPTNIEWLRTELVTVQEDVQYNPMLAKWFYMGREIPREDLFHVRAFTRAGHILGLSPIKTFGPTIAAGLGALQYGNDWFSNGGIPPGTFKNTQKTVDPTEADIVKQRLTAAIRTRQPLVYGADWDYASISVPPDEAQFLASMKLTATQIASIYDVPPERVGGEPGGSLTYATQEQDQIRLATTTGRWCTRLEHAFFSLLPERQFTRFNVDAMIRTDLKTRHEVFMLDRQMGLKSIDELRAIDDLEPLPAGEGKDYSPLAVAVAEATAAAKPAPAPTPAAGDTSPPVPARPRAVS
jgi:HK97 family phage portal protein